MLIEYADFRCGYCGKFARDTEPELVKKYVADGTLRIEWRNFPIFGEESEAAARAAWAAGQQGRFHAVPRRRLRRGSKEKGFGEPTGCAELAREAGVPDLDRFDRGHGRRAGRQAALRRTSEEALPASASPPPRPSSSTGSRSPAPSPPTRSPTRSTAAQAEAGPGAAKK